MSANSSRSTPRRAAAIAADAFNAAIAAYDADNTRIAAADALTRLSRVGPEWVPPSSAVGYTIPEWRPAPPTPSVLHNSEEDVRSQYQEAPPLVNVANRGRRWNSVTPGKRKAAHITQYLMDRFGEKSFIATEMWSLMPFIREPPGWFPEHLPVGWTAHIDDVGRQYYYNLETRTSQWGVPQKSDNDVPPPPPPPPPSTPPHTTVPNVAPNAPLRPTRRSRRVASQGPEHNFTV
jgi:hypothetical protein